MKPPVRARLAKTLALLASDHPGERDAAALAASRIVARSGTTWDQILGGNPAEPRDRWRATCSELAKRPGALRIWERKFVVEMQAFNRISPKQQTILDEIARFCQRERLRVADTSHRSQHPSRY
jgi:hypothetical protein